MAQARYPHLLYDDSRLWQLWYQDHLTDYTTLEYDVRIGSGRCCADYHPENIQRMAIELSQRRIDVLGRNADGITIIEVTMSAGLKAIGQMIAYPILFRETFGGQEPIHRLLIANRIQSDILPCLQELQIPHWSPAEPLTESQPRKLGAT